ALPRTVALAAVNRAARRRAERHPRRRAARGAHRVEHLAIAIARPRAVAIILLRRSIIALAALAALAVALAAVGAPRLARLAARFAALGNFAEALLLVELLLPGGEHELVLAVDALQRAILKVHQAPRSKKPPRQPTRGFTSQARERSANESPSSLYHFFAGEASRSGWGDAQELYGQRSFRMARSCDGTSGFGMTTFAPLTGAWPLAEITTTGIRERFRSARMAAIRSHPSRLGIIKSTIATARPLMPRILVSASAPSRDVKTR